jgi:LacI family transcriptional regulator
MATGAFSHIAILVYEDYEKAFEWNFIRQMIIQLESSISAHGYFPVIIPIKMGTPAKELFAKIQSSGTGGLFSIHYTNQELFTLLEDSGTPVVIINNSSLQDRFSTVCADDFQAAYEGTRHLLEMGHRDIGYLEYSRPDLPAFMVDCFIGYQKALREFHIDCDPSRKFCVDIRNMKDHQAVAGHLASMHPRPSALFAVDDYVAGRFVTVLPSVGIAFPQDLSIIAPGDVLDYVEPYIPRVTTMSLDTSMVGKLAGDIMVDRLENKDDFQVRVLKVRASLIDRGSCKEKI